MTHPRLRGRSTPKAPVANAMRALVHAPDESRRVWIESELARPEVIVQVSRSIAEVVAALTEDPPPRPQVLIVDFDSLTRGDLLHLHAIRQQGWFGAVFALGKVPLAARESLRIDRVIPRMAAGALRSVLPNFSFDMQTMRISKISG